MSRRTPTLVSWYQLAGFLLGGDAEQLVRLGPDEDDLGRRFLAELDQLPDDSRQLVRSLSFAETSLPTFSVDQIAILTAAMRRVTATIAQERKHHDARQKGGDIM